MEGTDVNTKLREDIKQSMESLCKWIDESNESQKTILHHLQAIVEQALEDKTISVNCSVDFFEDTICKDGIEFKIVLNWDFDKNGPVVWLDNLYKITEYLKVTNFKLIPKDNTLEIYIPFYILGVAVGCDKELLNDKEE